LEAHRLPQEALRGAGSSEQRESSEASASGQQSLSLPNSPSCPDIDSVRREAEQKYAAKSRTVIVHDGSWQTPCADLVNQRQVFLSPSSSHVIAEPRTSTCLASRIETAKSVVWRGRGELLQLPWPGRPSGLWLVIDLWSGFAGAVLALLALGVRCIVVAAESSLKVAHAARVNFPNIVHVESVEAIRAVDFIPVLRRRRFKGILIGGFTLSG
jgi:hypothetical protein